MPVRASRFFPAPDGSLLAIDSFDTNGRTVEAMPRFFSATAFAGRLYPEGILDRGPWDSQRLVYWDEYQVDMILSTYIWDLKVHTAEELREAVAAPSHVGDPAVKLWIAEGLEPVAKDIWKKDHSLRSSRQT